MQMTIEQAPRKSSYPFENFISLVLRRNYEAISPILTSKDFDINMEDFRGVTVLHYAAELDDDDLIKMILKEQPRARINSKTLEIMSTPLMIAAGNGKVKALKVLLENNADTSCQNASGYTALMLASEGGYLECVNILLEKGKCNIKIQNYFGQNALMLSVNHYEIAKTLIKHSDLSQVDTEGSSVLHLACLNGSLDVLKLISEEPDILINSKNFKGETAIHNAIHRQRLDFVAILLQNGASLLVKNSHGLTAFHYAAMYDESEVFFRTIECEKSEINDVLVLLSEFGRLETLKSLITNAENEALGDCFVSSAKGGHLDCLELLMEVDSFEPSTEVLVDSCSMALSENRFECFNFIYNLIMNVSDHIKEECYEYKEQVIATAFSSGCFEACQLFLMEGIDPNGPDPETYLMAASGNGHIKVVKLLLDHGADVNRKHESMGNALLLAVINNHLDIVKLLLLNGADTRINDESGFTPLICAAYYGYTEVFSEIFKVDQNTQDRTNDGLTPLMAAVISNDLVIVEALLKKRAKIDDTDELGNNCLHLAAENVKNINVLVYFLQKFDSSVQLLTDRNKANVSPLDSLIAHQNQNLLFSVLAAKIEINELLDSPLVVEIKEICHQDICLICRDDFVIGDMVSKLPCRHLFHEACYNEWAVTKANCPYCQRFPFKVKNK